VHRSTLYDVVAFKEVFTLKHCKQVLPMMSNFVKRLHDHEPDVTKVGLGKVKGINIMTLDRK
jgi:hypothetical protein